MLIHTDDIGPGPSIACYGSLTGIGEARLDNREELARAMGVPAAQVSDLELILRVLDHHGTRGISSLLGDFAFLVRDAVNHALFAARDAFGVKCLYYIERPGFVGAASRAELLAPGSEYEPEYLAALVAMATPPTDRCVYVGVGALDPGSTRDFSNGNGRSTRFWSPHEFEPRSVPQRSVEDISTQLRELLSQAVEVRTNRDATLWAMLSGGLDSSSVVSLIQSLAQARAIGEGLAGTVTFVDTRGADERDFSETVVRKYKIRNEQILNFEYFHDDGSPPPLVDQPHYLYPFYARDRHCAHLIRLAGGRVLLTGYGGDQLFIGNMFFFADWIANGLLRKGTLEMLRRAATGRVSFWALAYENALLPLLPHWFHHLFMSKKQRAPSWIPRGVLRRYGLEHRLGGSRAYAGARGRKYAHYVADELAQISSALLSYSVLEDELELRHPYLFRPLVEFALQLPPELCVQPHARKWVLRQAMRGVLPEAIRTRVGKATNYGPISWVLAHRRDEVARLLQNPILGQMGCIDPIKLRALAAEPHRCDADTNMNMAATLAIEMWLRVRAGHWETGQSGCSLVHTEEMRSAGTTIRRHI